MLGPLVTQNRQTCFAVARVMARAFVKVKGDAMQEIKTLLDAVKYFPLPNKLYVQISAIESFGVVK